MGHKVYGDEGLVDETGCRLSSLSGQGTCRIRVSMSGLDYNGFTGSAT